MGCGKSKQIAEDKKVVTDVSQIKLDTLSRAERFEVQIPIRLTDVNDYCRIIREAHHDKKTLTVKELMDAMNGQEAWKKVTPGSVFMTLLESCDLLKGDNGELSKNALMLWGIVLCGGKSKVKVQAFYDVLQDNNQDRISAEDKDCPGNFTWMIDLATKVVNEYEAKVSKQTPEKDEDFLKKLDGMKEKLAEDIFLDPVFGPNSNLLRKEWEEKVLTEAKWIFDSSKLRATIYAKVTA